MCSAVWPILSYETKIRLALSISGFYGSSSVYSVCFKVKVGFPRPMGQFTFLFAFQRNFVELIAETWFRIISS